MSTKSIKFYVVVVTTCLFTRLETMTAQVTIGADKLPETFSVLQLEGKYGDNKYGGFRMPRLTTEERNKLLSSAADTIEAAGLAIYNTSKNCMEYWNGRQWLPDNNCCPNRIMDIDGNSYTAAQFGEAGCWMTQNLRVTRYANSKPLAMTYEYPEGKDSIFNNNPEYGLLYTWIAASNGENTDEFTSGAGATESRLQGICPEGWVLPSDKDWNHLEKEVVEHASNYSNKVVNASWDSNWESAIGWRGGKQGKVMNSSQMVGTYPGGLSKAANDNGFNSLFVGHIFQGQVSCYGTSTCFWSSSEFNTTSAWYRNFDSLNETGYRTSVDKNYYLSVRCKKRDN